MDVVKLLADAHRDGVTIVLDGESLKVTGTVAKKKRWSEKLAPHKPAILLHLSGKPTEPIPAAEPIIRSYTPFPVHTLPGPVGTFTAAAAAAIGCDPSFIALPLLACLARAIGNRRVIRLKSTWKEPAIIWAAIIGKSGTHKTPSINAAMQFLQQKQSESIAAFHEAQARYEQGLACYERDLAAWKRLKDTTEQAPWAPAEPSCNRFITSDTTIEALAALLAVQFDGLLVCRDELAGWFGGIAEYKGGKGSDLGHWLAAWSAQPSTWDRKTGPTRMLHVPRVSVNLVGGIQPGVLQRAIGREHMQDGLCARLLLAMPDPKPVRWTEATVEPATEAALAGVFDKLLSMESALGADDKPEPFALGLTPEAKAIWVKYYNGHRAEGAHLDDDLAAAWSKLEAYTARFALIFQLCSWAAGEAGDDAVDEAAMQAAIELSDWFGGEARRVYGLFVESEEDRERRELVDLIRRRGSRITARQLQQGSRRLTTSAEAEAALEGLVRCSWGRWEPVQTATKPTREFVLLLPYTSTDSRKPPESGRTVDVDALDWTSSGEGRAAS